MPSLVVTLGLSGLAHLALFIVWSPLCGCNQLTPPEQLASTPGLVSIKLVASESVQPRPTEAIPDVPMLDMPTPVTEVNVPLVPPVTTERPRERVEETPAAVAKTKTILPAAVPDLAAELVPIVTTPAATAKKEAPRIDAIDRPRERRDVAPNLPVETRVKPPVEVPELAELAPTLPPQVATKQPAKVQPIARPRLDSEPTLTPTRVKVEPVKLPDLPTELVPVPPIKELAKKPDPLKPSKFERPKIETAQPTLKTESKVAEVAMKASPNSQEMQGVVDDLPRRLPINPPPPYPEDARLAGQEGTVWLKVSISAEGRVTAISIHTSSGSQSLDNAAYNAMRHYQYAPARRGGRAVAYEVLDGVEFSIRRR